MKCTINNLNKVFSFIKEQHLSNQTGADFVQFDDESNLIDAVKSTIEQFTQNDIDKCFEDFED